jgi:hypothetical protein
VSATRRNQPCQAGRKLESIKPLTGPIGSPADAPKRRSLVQSDVIGPVALDLVLGFVLARVVHVAFVIHVLRVHLNDPAADPPRLRVPAYAVTSVESHHICDRRLLDVGHVAWRCGNADDEGENDRGLTATDTKPIAQPGTSCPIESCEYTKCAPKSNPNQIEPLIDCHSNTLGNAAFARPQADMQAAL